ncbi:cilia- and flagella-associated protein 251-like isoform X2 [Liolophura sinensis]|uniref:cilia- and flagella-associated protein 251-like isoform X2 n=1 Tax=Liolophura sinensis TaxID=3198878 RepID=UPI0031580B5E
MADAEETNPPAENTMENEPQQQNETSTNGADAGTNLATENTDTLVASESAEQIEGNTSSAGENNLPAEDVTQPTGEAEQVTHSADDTQTPPEDDTNATSAETTPPKDDTNAASAENTQAPPKDDTNAASAENAQAPSAQDTQERPSDEAQAQPTEGQAAVSDQHPCETEELGEIVGPEPSSTSMPGKGMSLSTSKQDSVAPPNTEAEPQTEQSGSGAPTPPPALTKTSRPSTAASEVVLTNTALNMVWSFGHNRNVPVLNLSDSERKLIMYTCAHTGIIYDFISNKQYLLQGHANAITCTCVSEDKKWLATSDKGEGSMVIVWDTHTNTPVQTLFEPAVSGVVCISMTRDARYLATLSAGPKQMLCVWDWTVDGDAPICSAELKSSYGLQNYIHFNPEDIHFIVTNSESQVIFYNWEPGRMEYYAPPLTDQDFNKPVGRYSQSIFQSNSSRALTATSIGNLVVWESNKPITKAHNLPSADKKPLKIIRLQEKGINVLTVTDQFIVVGDTAGHVKFFDQSLKLVNWYQSFNLGSVNSLSFEYVDNFSQVAPESSKYPPDATILASQFVIRDFIVGTHSAMFGHVTAEGTKVKVIHKEHDAATHALASHPFQCWMAVGGFSGFLKVWDYRKKIVIGSRQFEKGNHIYSCTYDPKGAFLAVGFANGSVRILDAISLDEETEEVLRYSRDTVTHIVFSHDSQYLATAYVGRYRAHYKLIKDIMFGIQLDSNFPRLLSLGEDRVLVEYDLENSTDGLKILSSDRIEQSAIPTCMEWYPPITKENFILTANDQFKYKLYNATTKMCRKTLLGPAYGSPIKKLCVIPTADEINDKRYLAYITKDKVGLQIFPLDGNPHNSMALIAHPGGASNMAVSHDGKYLFTVGGADATLHMWYININALEAQASVGGKDLIPFYGLLDGGRDGELFAELEDYFYYAQIRNQGVNTMDTRMVDIKIPLSEVPFVMRAMGFYPSEQEIEDMLNEVKFSQYVETGEFVDDIDLGDFIKLYINHRPAFGLSTNKLAWAFEKLGLPSEYGYSVDRGDLLDILQTKGEHMTEIELAEYLTTLMGFNEEGGSSELHEFDPTTAGDLLDANLPVQINAGLFAQEILGFSMMGEDATSAS